MVLFHALFFLYNVFFSETQTHSTPFPALRTACVIGIIVNKCFGQFLYSVCVFSLAGSACTMSEYNKLKSMLLDMQPKVMKTGEQSQQRDMEEKRALVDTMFKYLDVNQDSRLVSEELEKVSLELKCLDQILTWTLGPFICLGFCVMNSYIVRTQKSYEEWNEEEMFSSIPFL